MSVLTLLPPEIVLSIVGHLDISSTKRLLASDDTLKALYEPHLHKAYIAKLILLQPLIIRLLKRTYIWMNTVGGCALPNVKELDEFYRFLTPYVERTFQETDISVTSRYYPYEPAQLSRSFPDSERGSQAIVFMDQLQARNLKSMGDRLFSIPEGYWWMSESTQHVTLDLLEEINQIIG